MTSEVISWLEDVLPEIKRTQDPEGAILKFAESRNLAPALLEKLAQVYNSAKTLNFLEKSADRGASFHVVDADALLKRYTSDTPKQASEFSEWIDTPSIKSAALTYSVADRFPRESALRFETEPTVAPVMSKLAERNEFETARRNQETYEQVMFDLGEDVYVKSARIAETIRTLPEFDFEGFEAGALLITESGIKEAATEVSKRLAKKHYQHKRAHGPGDAAFSPRDLELLESVKELQTAIDTHAFAGTRKDEFCKWAAKGPVDENGSYLYSYDLDEYGNQVKIDNRTNTGVQRTGTRNQRTEAEPAPEDKPEGGSETKPESKKERPKSEWLADTFKAVPKSPFQTTNLIRGLALDALPTRNVGQENIDREFEDTQTQVVLERLMLTDPILGDADPHVVLSLANSIREQSPHIAKDINAMRFALREAVQYNSLPTHTVKDLTGIEKTRVDTESGARGIAKDKYSIGMKPSKPAAK